MKNTKWFDRVQKMTDIVTRLTHLTRATESMDAIEVLLKIHYFTV